MDEKTHTHKKVIQQFRPNLSLTQFQNWSTSAGWGVGDGETWGKLQSKFLCSADCHQQLRACRIYWGRSFLSSREPPRALSLKGIERLLFWVGKQIVWYENMKFQNIVQKIFWQFIVRMVYMYFYDPVVLDLALWIYHFILLLTPKSSNNIF